MLGHVGIYFFGRQNFFLRKPMQSVVKSYFQKMRTVFQIGGVQQLGTLPNHPVGGKIGHKKPGIRLFLLIDEKPFKVGRNLGED